MRTSPQLTGIIITALLLGVSAAAAGADGTTTTAAKDPCCFDNPRFSGTCQVTPGEDESCGDILGYLNNPNSVGKAYCGNTRIRGGWHTVACDAENTNTLSAIAPAQQTRE